MTTADRPTDADSLGRRILALPTLPDLERAREAKLLLTEAPKILSAVYTAAVVAEATGRLHADVAKDLGVRPGTVDMIVYRHKRSKTSDAETQPAPNPEEN